MTSEKEILVPDIGGATGVEVIEVQVATGDTVSAEDSLITLEGDKATMEIPAPEAGTIKAIKVAVGDKVSEGTPILMLDVKEASAEKVPEKTLEKTEAATPSEPAPQKSTTQQPQPVSHSPVPSSPPSPNTEKAEAPAKPEANVTTSTDTNAHIHAGPAVRRLARELGVDLAQVSGSGEKGRIIKADVDNYVKQQLSRLSSGPAALGGGGLSVAPAQPIDFSQFGTTETCELTRIKKIAGASLHRNWVTIPHVTQFGEADITELEAFRCQHKAEAAARGLRLTPVVFIIKALVAALKAYPHFNASLNPSGEQLILKHYFNIGVAVDTPHGLVVPVIRQADQKSLFELAQELLAASEKARSGKLTVSDMQGSSFTLSSLGGIGGTAFTPIINAPDVAILGVSKAQIKPMHQDNTFVPRLMLPLSLSYDHRVIDGADGARFLVYLADCLTDIRRVLL